jgi:hypothetical protein
LDSEKQAWTAKNRPGQQKSTFWTAKKPCWTAKSRPGQQKTTKNHPIAYLFQGRSKKNIGH